MMVIKQRQPLILQRGKPRFPEYLPSAGIYVHVPFCKNLCPYCPYNRWEYENRQYARFEEAIKIEISNARSQTAVGHIPSLYIGGGTPTVDPDGLLRILSHVRSEFGQLDSTCVELHPSWMPLETLKKLKEGGVNAVSIGAQSFHDRHLQKIGRSNHAAETRQAVANAVKTEFETINVDILFALPDETADEVRRDAETAIECGANQISAYPLFGFPYSESGKNVGSTQVRRPGGRLMRRMLSVIDEVAESHGFRRCAVWSWIKPGAEKFSSASRHVYLGFGPGAASMTGREFFINTFPIDSYVESVHGEGPTALCMPMDEYREMAYWIYWRLYEMKVGSSDFNALFHKNLSTQVGYLFLLPRVLGLRRKNDNGYEVTGRGAYWIHRLQNEFSLDYIAKTWGLCRSNPWPETVIL